MAPKGKKRRYTCQCHCGCRRRPGRLVICDWCGQGVGPDCCRFHEDEIRAYCHWCREPHPEHNDVQPEHNGLQPEHNGLQPGHNGLQPEHNGLQPEQNGLQSDFVDLVNQSLQNGGAAIIHCNQGYHRGPCLLPQLAMMLGERRCLGRTQSCPADMSPPGSVRFEAMLRAHRDERELITERIFYTD